MPAPLATGLDALLASVAAQPKTHAVVMTYASGKVRRFETRNLASAETHAIGERRKIGRDLIDRETGGKVHVVSVEIEALS